jgi:hypothetical protein
MNKIWRIFAPVGLSVLLVLALCGPSRPARSIAGEEAPAPGAWRELLAKRLPLFGHRNWIVIADSAYPAQSRFAIETVATGADQLEVVRTVLEQLAKTKHVRPIVHLDAELPRVEESDAPGIDRYRVRLKRLLAGLEERHVPHEGIIDRLDKAGEKFHILILKTNLRIPYTSVFLELDCGYWSAAAEKRLRKALKGKTTKKSRKAP